MWLFNAILKSLDKVTPRPGTIGSEDVRCSGLGLGVEGKPGFSMQFSSNENLKSRFGTEGLRPRMSKIGASIIRIGFGLWYTIIITGNPQNLIPIIKAPTLLKTGAPSAVQSSSKLCAKTFRKEASAFRGSGLRVLFFLSTFKGSGFSV